MLSQCNKSSVGSGRQTDEVVGVITVATTISDMWYTMWEHVTSHPTSSLESESGVGPRTVPIWFASRSRWAAPRKLLHNHISWQQPCRNWNTRKLHSRRLEENIPQNKVWEPYSIETAEEDEGSIRGLGNATHLAPQPLNATRTPCVSAFHAPAAREVAPALTPRVLCTTEHFSPPTTRGLRVDNLIPLQ